ncbi:MAG: RDD family protein [Planctomycetota bacterium]
MPHQNHDLFRGDFFCHFCNKTRPRKQAADVMGAAMCRKCCVNQANRRQLAFLLEGPISILVFVGYAFLVGFVTPLLGLNPDAEAGVVAMLLIGGALLILVLSPLRRDCTFFGALGKRVCGVRAVDRDTLEPISAWASFKRNLVLFVPFAKLFIGSSLVKAGPRCGDGWANSVVLRKKDLGHPVFHGAKTCRTCWAIFDPTDPAGCLDCVAEPTRGGGA